MKLKSLILILLTVVISCKKNNIDTTDAPKAELPAVLIPANDSKAYGQYSGLYVRQSSSNTFFGIFRMEVRNTQSKLFWREGSLLYESGGNSNIADGANVSNLNFQLGFYSFYFGVNSNGENPSISLDASGFRVPIVTICKDYSFTSSSHYIGYLKYTTYSQTINYPMILSIDKNNKASGGFVDSDGTFHRIQPDPISPNRYWLYRSVNSSSIIYVNINESTVNEGSGTPQGYTINLSKVTY